MQKKFGLPVDNRTDTSLIDWALWSIAPARNDADFQALLEPIWRYANETPSRVPLSDWFVTTDAKKRGFQARPVVGGIFVKMLSDAPTWQKWARRGVNPTGPWAPIPIGSVAREVVPTAQTVQVKWRYTLEQPATDWTKPGFDDSAWKEGVGGFGTKGTPGATSSAMSEPRPQLFSHFHFGVRVTPRENNPSSAPARSTSNRPRISAGDIVFPGSGYFAR